LGRPFIEVGANLINLGIRMAGDEWWDDLRQCNEADCLCNVEVYPLVNVTNVDSFVDDPFGEGGIFDETGQPEDPR